MSNFTLLSKKMSRSFTREFSRELSPENVMRIKVDETPPDVPYRELLLQHSNTQQLSHLWVQSHHTVKKRSAKKDFFQSKLSEPDTSQRTQTRYLILSKTTQRSWPTTNVRMLESKVEDLILT